MSQLTPGQKKYEEVAGKIYDTYGPDTFKAVAKAYSAELKRIYDAKTEAEAEQAWKSFGQNVGTPELENNLKTGSLKPEDISKFRSVFNAYAQPETLGSYEDMKKNKAFNKAEWKNTAKNDKGEEVENVPVLAIVNDPARLQIVAEELGMQPEYVRSYAQAQFAKYQKDLGKKLDAQRVEETNQAREKIVSKFENSNIVDLPLVGSIGYNTAARFVAPELTNWAKTAVLTGDDSQGMGKAILKDIAYQGASLAGGHGTTKIVGKVATKVGERFLPYVSAGIGAAKDAAVEGAREAASDYEKVDSDQISKTFGASFTLPAAITGFSRVGRQVQNAGQVGGIGSTIRNGNFGNTKKGQALSGAYNAALMGGARDPLNDKFDEEKKTDDLKIRMWKAGFVPKDQESEDYEEYQKWYQEEHEANK